MKGRRERGLVRRASLRVCIDARGVSERPTGAGKALRYLLRQLGADFPQHEYVACEPRGAPSWPLWRQLAWEQIGLPLQARRLRADLIHTPLGTSSPLLRRVPLVTTVHDLAPTRHPELLPRGRSRWYWGRWVPFTARFADRVLVPSASTRRDLVALAGVRDERITVVPWGVPLEDLVGASTGDVIATYGLVDPFLLYVGTIDRRKDYRTLLAALARLDPAVRLVIAGTVIAGRTDFPETVRRLGLEPRVTVLGYVPERDLPALYRAARVFVYPSFYEGFGLPVLEAMACGTPVVTYNVTSLPEVAGDAARLLDGPVTPERLADEIGRLVDDAALRRELSERGRAWARRFDWGRTARLTVEAYEAIAR
jgi:glycosyltransferase involved in cell wall biosynthesis